MPRLIGECKVQESKHDAHDQYDSMWHNTGICMYIAYVSQCEQTCVAEVILTEPRTEVAGCE